MNWTLRYSKRAAKDAKKLSRAGLSLAFKKLLELLVENPFRNPPPYEKLSGELKGTFARRINKQHRLVYEVIKREKIVNVLQMWTHYE